MGRSYAIDTDEGAGPTARANPWQVPGFRTQVYTGQTGVPACTRSVAETGGPCAVPGCTASGLDQAGVTRRYFVVRDPGDIFAVSMPGREF